jgi:ABC-type multidrug transport system fused ATPase/permease subunit
VNPLKALLKQYRRSILTALVITIITTVPTLLSVVALGYVVDAVRAGTASEVTRWSIGLALLALIGAVLWIPRARSVTHAALNVEADIRSRIFDRILRVDLFTLGSLDIGQVVLRATADLRLIRSFLSSGIPVIAQVVAGYTFLVVTAGYNHPLLGLATLIPVALVLFIAFARVRNDSKDPAIARGLLGDATTVMDESLQAVDSVRADDSRDSAFTKVSDLLTTARHAITPVLFRNAAITAIMSAIPYLAFAAVLGVGGLLISRGDDVSIGELVAVSLLMLHVAAPTISLGTFIAEGQNAAAAAERIETVLAWPDAGPDPRTSSAVTKVSDLSFVNGSDSILKSIDIDQSARKTLGIQGDPASGKTLLLQSLHGMVPQVTGEIRVPSTTLVTCDDSIFHGTIREAVTYGAASVSDEELQLAATRSHLMEVVNGLPNGWDTELGGSTGVVLSGGEMQRIRLARGLLSNSDLLLLDAAMVGLDALTLETVNDGISQQRNGRELITTAYAPAGLGPTTGRATLSRGQLTPAPDAPPQQPVTPTQSQSSTQQQTQQSQQQPATKKTPGKLKARAKLIVSLLRPDAGWLALAMFCVAITAAAALVPIYLSMELIQDLSGSTGDERLGLVVAVLVGVAIVFGLALFLCEFLVPWIGQRGLNRLRLRAFRALLDVHLAYFDRQRIGAIISKLTNNIELLQTTVKSGARTVVSSVVTLVIVGGLLVIIDRELAIIAYLVFPVIIIFAVILLRAQRWSLAKNIAGISDLTVCIRDAVQGAATIRSFGTQDQHREEFDRFNEFERTALARSSYVFKSFAAATQFVVALDVALIVALGGQDAVAGAVAVTTMVLFATYLQNGISPISSLATMQAVYGQSGVAMDQLVKIVNLHPDSQLAGTKSAVNPDPSIPAIRYDHVWFAFTNAGWVLKDASLDVMPGEHLVVVGRTGAGKSSLVKLGLRFYAPIKGNVEVFGIPVAEADEHWLRQQIAYVPQEPTAFSESIRDNLRMSKPDASQSELDAVVAALGIEQSVIADLGGWDAVIGSAGSMPSAGQRQLIAIARALVANRPILILDEATSYLTPEAEQAVINALRFGNPNRSIIAIAHHLAWAPQGDKVAVIAQHKIDQYGTHQELLNEEGTYAKLWAASQLTQ